MAYMYVIVIEASWLTTDSFPGLHGATSQTTAILIFMLVAVRTWNLIQALPDSKFTKAC
jgi:hypothetical protein